MKQFPMLTKKTITRNLRLTRIVKAILLGLAVHFCVWTLPAFGQIILQPDIPHPAVVTAGGERLEMFVVGKNSHLVQRSWNGQKWSGWKNLGGDLTSAAAAVSPTPGRIDVFVRGMNGHLVQRTWRNGQWSGWINLGGDLTSAPAAVSPSPMRIEVFVRGMNGHLVQRTWRNGKWSGWNNLGGDLGACPTMRVCQKK